MLRGRIVEGPQGFLARGEAGSAQTPRGAAQLVLDAVLHGAEEIDAPRADVLRFEPFEPREGVMQHVLHQIARRDPRRVPTAAGGRLRVSAARARYRANSASTAEGLPRRT